MLKKKRSPLRPSVLLVAQACAFMAATSVQAQQSNGVAASAAGGQEPERIQVTGLRSSLDRARDEKRIGSEFVDAVSAADVGKLADKNIAEALQRVPGVTIERNRGEGDFVSIRGLPPAFVRGSVNGRTLVSASESSNSVLSGGAQSSTGRETNYDILPSEIIDVLQVFKSNAAEHIEGGLAGSVNIKTARPLSLGNKLVLSGADLYSGFSKKHAPNLAGLWSWKNEDNSFGALATLTYSERHIRSAAAETYAYSSNADLGSPDSFDTRNSGAANAKGVLFPFAFIPQTFEEDRRNTGLNTTLQWRPSAATEVTLDVLTSQRKREYNTLQSIYTTTPAAPLGGWYGNVPGVFGSPNADGSIPYPSLVVGATNTAASYQTAADVTSVTDRQTGSDSSQNIGLNVKHSVGDWKLSSDLSLAGAKGTERFDRATFMPFGADGKTLTGQLGVTTTGGTIAVAPSPALASIIADGSTYHTNNFQRDARTNTDKEQALRLDAERALSNGFFDAVKFGVRYAERTKDLSVTGLASGQLKDTSGKPVYLPLSGASGVTYMASNPVPGVNIGYDPSTMPFAVDPVQVLNALGQKAAAGSLDPVFNPLRSYRIKEKTNAAYAQLEINTELATLPVTGNVGLRYVQTTTDSTGYRRPFKLVTGENNIGNVEYTAAGVSTLESSSSDNHLLPSLNLKVELSKNVQLRGAYSRSLTRPLFSDLTPGYTGTPNPTQRSAAIGNANLKPLLADNFDLGVEWYPGKSGLLAANAFHKRLDGIVGATTTLNVNYDGNNWRSLSMPTNLGKGTVSGFEFAVQQAFTALPEPWNGLGMVANVTTTNSNAHDNNGNAMSVPGVSKYSLNTQLYFEKGPFEVRIAHTYRDDFLVLNSDVFAQRVYAKGYGQIDLSASYKLGKGLDVFANVINLGANTAVLYSSNAANPATASTRPQSVDYVGRRFMTGLRWSL